MFNPIALRKAKIVCNFGLSECNRVTEGGSNTQLTLSKSNYRHMHIIMILIQDQLMNIDFEQFFYSNIFQ